MTSIRRLTLPVRGNTHRILRGNSHLPEHLQEFAGIWAFINKDDANKEDIATTGGKLEFTARKTLAVPTKDGTKEFGFTPWSYDQFAKSLGIPPKYLASCPITGKGGQKDQIDLRMEGKANTTMLVRLRHTPTEEGLEGLVRAVLPEDYAIFDNRHLVQAVQTSIRQTGLKFRLEMSNIQDPRSIERSLHMRMLADTDFDIMKPDGVGDPHKIGFHCLTSEVGDGDIEISALVYRLICTNGMMGWGDSEIMRVRHRHFQPHEMTPRFQEGILSSARQSDAIKELLERKYNELIGSDPMSAFMLMAGRLKASEFVRDTAMAVLQRDRKPQYSRFDIMQSFTEAAQSLPMQERLRLEMAVGRTFLGGGGRPASRAAIDTTGEDVTDTAN